VGPHGRGGLGLSRLERGEPRLGRVDVGLRLVQGRVRVAFRPLEVGKLALDGRKSPRSRR
jgi:hypothetical protein